MQALTIFFAQFALVFLLGFQSQYVRDARKVHAAIVSLMLGIASWLITGIVSTAYKEGAMSLVFFSFICSGPLGITASIYLHQKFHKKGNKCST